MGEEAVAGSLDSPAVVAAPPADPDAAGEGFAAAEPDTGGETAAFGAALEAISRLTRAEKASLLHRLVDELADTSPDSRPSMKITSVPR